MSAVVGTRMRFVAVAGRRQRPNRVIHDRMLAHSSRFDRLR
jgi:hypothetical protein